MRPYAVAALSSQFIDGADFDSFYLRLSDESKDEFLRVGSLYLFLVKRGDWHVDLEDVNPVVDYLTNSFKLVTLFSLIESLGSDSHQDFYEWLIKSGDGIYPIADKASLTSMQQRYKETFGSIRRCVRFFENLPALSQEKLCESIQFNMKATKSIKDVANFLYNLRSKFVHEGQLVLELNEVSSISNVKNEMVITSLRMSELLFAFEEGVVAHFRHIKSN